MGAAVPARTEIGRLRQQLPRYFCTTGAPAGLST